MQETKDQKDQRIKGRDDQREERQSDTCPEMTEGHKLSSTSSPCDIKS